MCILFCHNNRKVLINGLRPTETNGKEKENQEAYESEEAPCKTHPVEKNGVDTKSKAMAEKYCLMYIVDLNISNINYKVWCCSIPFAYYVHNSQIPEGLGTLFWDKYFGKPGRIPFVVPDKVSWSEMRSALNDYFKTMTKSQRDFNDVSPHGKWGWFYSCVELTNKHLTPYWQNGYILGFINLKEAEDLLSAHKPGDFIVRFSNSVDGGVSVTVFRPRGNGPGTSSRNSVLKAENSMPFTSRDLDHLKELKSTFSDLILMYPYYVNVYYQNKDGPVVSEPKAGAFIPPPVKLCKNRTRNVTTMKTGKYVSMKFILQAVSEA
ncbi:unnamed protein product [Allacma fusca]|uniref:SH2 domain-containing protein n=1 Tax=Allacma fusca TaxID=39272 RepID=A0A8J2KF35_9HEXA|nr:unnamed protein product [Allacma fusca]